MVVIIDADYREETRRGHAAGVLAESLTDEKETAVVCATVEDVGDYIPGQFYRRELKCVDAILRQLPGGSVSLIVIDGYADSGTPQKALGTYVFEQYGVPVIGVAKNRYKGCAVSDTEITRGTCRKKLYVTAKGMDHEAAKDLIRRMHGPYRLPYLIKLADTCARDWS